MKESHSLFLLFLGLLTCCALVSLSFKGCNYYRTDITQRPFHQEYSTMKPSGFYSHGLGIIGSLMIIVGVATYSSRKRIRSLWKAGKLSKWLEFHIFLCLIGPVLVVYHTTFKAGGIAAISLWTMLSVAASGIIGRFLYTLIPRNLNGNELSLEEIRSRLSNQTVSLDSSALGAQITNIIDESFACIQKPNSIREALHTLIHLQRVKSKIKHATTRLIKGSNVSASVAREITATANARSTLLQKSLVLQQVERLFFYWHAIHLPFTVIMFITLAAHVVVAILLGYRWIL